MIIQIVQLFGQQIEDFSVYSCLKNYQIIRLDILITSIQIATYSSTTMASGKTDVAEVQIQCGKQERFSLWFIGKLHVCAKRP